VWITGFQTEMVGADGVTPTLPEFMCHVNLDFNAMEHKQLMGSGSNANSRILTLSQGQINVRFPEGFGMPVLSNEPLSLNTQVLNHNLEHPNMQVRHKITFTFARDSDLKEPLKPLFNDSAFGMKLLEGKDGHYGMGSVDMVKHGPSCLPGDTAPNAHGGSIYQDQFASKFTGHWVVKPGRETNHTNVTKYMNLPYDTTLHFAAVHLHPYAVSLELRDLTTGKSVFKSKARSFKDKIGLSFVDSFSSAKGVPLFRDHEYDLVSVYNNTTQTDKDSMAVVLLFMLDKDFKKPTIVSGPVVSPVTASVALHPTRVRFRTSLGELVFKLYPDVAPATVGHFLELVQAGVYNSARFYRIEPGFVAQTALVEDRPTPMTPQQRALLHMVPAEFSQIPHRRGILSLARQDNDVNSGDNSFSILLGPAPHLDGKYTVFGEVEKGFKILDKIEHVERDANNIPRQRLEIRQAEMLPPESDAISGK
jgi:cyclophilin family peptidyl-prolyl cis-trans isomerase